MSDQNDDTQNYALALLAGIVALVIAGVIALAVSTSMSKSAGGAPAATTAAPAAEGLGPVEKLYFELGAADLPADAGEALARVAEAARANASASVVISGFHDASGDPEKNAELAKNRALAVRHALEANGVDPQRLVMSKPAATTGGTDEREARRVEVRLQ
jgi:outer membrane protein OmpA-like peptidoglycan-associated protein